MAWYAGDVGRVVKADRKTRYPDRRGSLVRVIRRGSAVFNGEPGGLGPFDTGATRSLPEGVLEVRDLNTNEVFRVPRGWLIKEKLPKSLTADLKTAKDCSTLQAKAKAVSSAFADAFEEELEEEEMEKAKWEDVKKDFYALTALRIHSESDPDKEIVGRVADLAETALYDRLKDGVER